MPGNWTRVFGGGISSGGCSGMTATDCPLSCYNFTSNNTVGQVTLLSQFPPHIKSYAQIFGIVAEELKNRLCAKQIIVRSPTDFDFYFDIRLGPRKMDTVTAILRPQGTTGYPVQCSYEYKRKDITGSSGFNDLWQLVDWLTSQLGR